MSSQMTRLRLDRRRRKPRRIAAILLCLAQLAAATTRGGPQEDGEVEADESSASKSTEVSHETARHRFDAGLQLVDTPTGYVVVGLLGYTWAFKPHMSFSLGITVFLDVVPPEVRASHMAEYNNHALQNVPKNRRG